MVGKDGTVAEYLRDDQFEVDGINWPLIWGPFIPTKMGWKEANKYCEGLSDLGMSWRLPTADEFQRAGNKSNHLLISNPIPVSLLAVNKGRPAEPWTANYYGETARVFNGGRNDAIFSGVGGDARCVAHPSKQKSDIKIPCGQSGTVEERMIDCNETRAHGAKVISRYVNASGRVEQFTYDSVSKVIVGPDISAYELVNGKRFNTQAEKHKAMIQLCADKANQEPYKSLAKNWKLPSKEEFLHLFNDEKSKNRRLNKKIHESMPGMKSGTYLTSTAEPRAGNIAYYGEGMIRYGTVWDFKIRCLGQ